jgi:hypothetical protein
MGHTIVVQGKFKSPFGKGECRDEGHVLLRPFDRLMHQSVPQEPIKILFVQSPETEVPSHVVGVITYSLGRRIVFFPGLCDRTVVVTPKNGAVVGKRIHHISVEPDLKDWHATTASSKDHETVGKTRLLMPDLYHLYSMSVRCTKSLEQTPELIEMSVSTTEKDGPRRAERFRNALEDAEHQLITLDRNFDGFLNFDFYLDQRKDKVDASYKSWLPPESDFHTLEVPKEEDICKIHSIELVNLPGNLVVKAVWLRGSLKYDAIFSELPAK